MFEPQDAREAYNRGLEYLDYNEPDQAIVAFTEAIRLNARHAHAFFARGCAWSERGEYAKAIADYNTALEIDPGYAGAQTNRNDAEHRLRNESAGRKAEARSPKKPAAAER